MYDDLIIYPIAHKNLRWKSKEVIIDIDGIPHLFQMLTLTGTQFPIRALESRVWVGDVFARHVLTSEDGLIVRAYFDTALPEADIFFGYPGQAELCFGKYHPDKLIKLGRSRLPPGIILYDTIF